MYEAHFGLSERPFAITPDPRYLFMSARHREALAHLLYGIDEGGGFVLLTGEVGTGKTTVTRALLDRVPDRVDVALILNPRLSAPELVATICDELGIEHPGPESSLKVLVDHLNAYLLSAHGRGRRTLLIIDEAQNLGIEVLEQIRLLTNLETTRHKLLRIVLVGQPELNELLSRRELRQLAQRITARYHLDTLDRADCEAYVRHRLAVAGARDNPFDRAALKTLCRLASGTPRLINSIGDRALLGAYAHDRQRIGAAVVRRAAAEVTGRTPSRYRSGLPAVVSVLVVLGVVGLLLGRGADLSQRFLAWQTTATPQVSAPAASGPDAPPEVRHTSSSPDESGTENTAKPADQAPEQVTPSFPAPSSEAPKALQEAALPIHAPDPQPPSSSMTPPNLAPTGAPQAALAETAGNPPSPSPAEIATPASASTQPLPTPPAPPDGPQPGSDAEFILRLAEPSPAQERRSALAGLALLWGVDSGLGTGPLCDRVTGSGLECLTIDTTLERLLSLDLPAVLELAVAGGMTHSGLMSRADAGHVLVRLEDNVYRVSKGALQDSWNSRAILIWRPPAALPRILAPGMRGNDVAWLRTALERLGIRPRAVGGPAGQDRRYFGTELGERVRDFQRRRGLEADAIVGIRTRLHLAAALPATDTPRPKLSDASETGQVLPLP